MGTGKGIEIGLKEIKIREKSEKNVITSFDLNLLELG